MVQTSPVKNFLSCFVQHVILHFIAKCWIKIFREMGATISWSSNFKKIFGLIFLKNIKISIAHNYGSTGPIKKFQCGWTQKSDIFPLIKFHEFWWESGENSQFSWITWHWMTPYLNIWRYLTNKQHHIWCFLVHYREPSWSLERIQQEQLYPTANRIVSDVTLWQPPSVCSNMCSNSSSLSLRVHQIS